MRPKGSAPASICSPTTSPPSQIPSCTSSSQISLKAFDGHWRYGTGYTVPVLIASGNSSPRVTSALKTFTFGGKPLTPSPARPHGRSTEAVHCWCHVSTARVLPVPAPAPARGVAKLHRHIYPPPPATAARASSMSCTV